MNIKIAVCDDEQRQTEYIKMLVSKWADQNNMKINISMFGNAESFKSAWSENRSFDILLLDIQMSGQNGVELAKEIRQSDDKMIIVFITGYMDYISEGYDVSALHYLMKPVKENKLFKVLNKALGRLIQTNKSLILTIDGETHQIPLYKISYLEVWHNYVTIHVDSNYTVKKTLSEIESELDDSFFRAGRSYIINLKYIRKSTKKEIYLKSGAVIPLPRGLYESLNRAMIEKL
ncbi:MAG: LytTR family DNA-binding domain-containing protein [Oscillospiraceae bacterium]|nr:LytTR family DNA-binding domain-containing protein [Oscillospiraceae bacterium]